MSGRDHRSNANDAETTVRVEEATATTTETGTSGPALDNSVVLDAVEFSEEEETTLEWVGIDAAALGNDVEDPQWAGDQEQPAQDVADAEQGEATREGDGEDEAQASEAKAEEEPAVASEVLAEEKLEEDVSEVAREGALEEETAQDAVVQAQETKQAEAEQDLDEEQEAGELQGAEAGAGQATTDLPQGEGGGEPGPTGGQGANQATTRPAGNTGEPGGGSNAPDPAAGRVTNQVDTSGADQAGAQLEETAQIETPQVEADVQSDDPAIQGHIDSGLASVQSGADLAAQGYNSAVGALAGAVQSDVQGTVAAGVAEIDALATTPIEVEALPGNETALAELDATSQAGSAEIQAAAGEGGTEITAASSGARDAVTSEGQAGRDAIIAAAEAGGGEIDVAGEQAQAGIDAAASTFDGAVASAAGEVDAAVAQGQTGASEAQAAGVEGTTQITTATAEATAQGDAAGQGGVDAMVATADGAIVDGGALADAGMAEASAQADASEATIQETGSVTAAELEAGGAAGASAMGATGDAARGEIAGAAQSAVAAINGIAGAAGAPGVSADIGAVEQGGGEEVVGGESATAEVGAIEEAGGELEQVEQLGEEEEELPSEALESEALVEEADADLLAVEGPGGEAGQGAVGAVEGEIDGIVGAIEAETIRGDADGGGIEGIEQGGGEGVAIGEGGDRDGVEITGPEGLDIESIEGGGGVELGETGGIDGITDATFDHEVEASHPEIGDAVDGVIEDVSGGIEEATQGAQGQIDEAVGGIDAQIEGAEQGGIEQVEEQELTATEILEEGIAQETEGIEVQTGLDLTEMIDEEQAAQDAANQNAEAEHTAIDETAAQEVVQVEEEERGAEETINESAEQKSGAAEESGQAQQLTAEEIAKQKERDAITTVEELQVYLDQNLEEQSTSLETAYEGGKSSLGLTFDGWRMALAEEGSYAQLDVLNFMSEKRSEVDALVDDKTSAITQAVEDQKGLVEAEHKRQTDALVDALSAENASVESVASDLAGKVRTAGSEASKAILAKGETDAAAAEEDGRDAAAAQRDKKPAIDREDPNNARDRQRYEDNAVAALQAGRNAAAELRAAAQAAADNAVEVANTQAAEIEAMAASSSDALNQTKEQFAEELSAKLTEANNLLDQAAQTGLEQLEAERSRLSTELENAQKTALEDISTAVKNATAELDALEAEAMAAMDAAHAAALVVLEEKTAEAKELLEQSSEIAFEELKGAVLTCVDEIEVAVEGAVTAIETARQGAIEQGRATWETFRTAVETAKTTAKESVDTALLGIEEKLQGIVDETLPRIELVGTTATEYIRLEGEARVAKLHEVGQGVVENLITVAQQVHDDALAAVEDIETQFANFLAAYDDGIQSAIDSSNGSWDAIVAIEDATALIGDHDVDSDEHDEAAIAAARTMADQLAGLTPEQQQKVMDLVGDDVGIMFDAFAGKDFKGDAEAGQENYEFVAAFTRAGEALGQDNVALLTDIVAGKLPGLMEDSHENNDHEFLDAISASIENGNGALFGASLSEELHQDGELGWSSAVASKTDEGITSAIENYEAAHQAFAQKESWMNEWMLENVGLVGPEGVAAAEQAFIEQFSVGGDRYEEGDLSYAEYGQQQQIFASLLEGSAFISENWGDNDGMVVGDAHSRGKNVGAYASDDVDYWDEDGVMLTEEERGAMSRDAAIDRTRNVFSHVPDLMQENWVYDADSQQYVRDNFGSTVIADALLREAGDEDRTTWLDTASDLAHSGFFDDKDADDSDYELDEQFAGAERIEQPSFAEQFDTAVMMGGARASEMLMLGHGGQLNLDGVGAMAEVTDAMSHFVSEASQEDLASLAIDLQNLDREYAGQRNIDPKIWLESFNNTLAVYNGVNSTREAYDSDLKVNSGLQAFTGAMGMVGSTAAFLANENRSTLDNVRFAVDTNQGIFSVLNSLSETEKVGQYFAEDASTFFGGAAKKLGTLGSALSLASNLKTIFGDSSGEEVFSAFLSGAGDTSMLVASLASTGSTLAARATGIGTAFLAAKSLWDAAHIGFGEGNWSGAMVAALPALGAAIGMIGGPFGAALGLGIGTLASWGLTALGVGQPDPNNEFEQATEIMWTVALDELLGSRASEQEREDLAHILRNVDGDQREGYGPVLTMIASQRGMEPADMLATFVDWMRDPMIGEDGVDEMLKSAFLGVDLANKDQIEAAQEARRNGWDVEIPGLEYDDEEIDRAGAWFEDMQRTGAGATVEAELQQAYADEDWDTYQQLQSQLSYQYGYGMYGSSPEDWAYSSGYEYTGPGGNAAYDDVYDSEQAIADHREQQQPQGSQTPPGVAGPVYGPPAPGTSTAATFDPLAGVDTTLDGVNHSMYGYATDEQIALADATGLSDRQRAAAYYMAF